MNRRDFIILSASVATGCATCNMFAADQPATNSVEPIDAGPLEMFKETRVYDSHRDRGFFLIHRNKQLYAISSICTHKRCKVRLQDDQSFLCKCHNSHFSAEGKVTQGPAILDLPRHPLALTADEHVLVDLNQITTDRS